MQPATQKNFAYFLPPTNTIERIRSSAAVPGKWIYADLEGKRGALQNIHLGGKNGLIASGRASLLQFIPESVIIFNFALAV